MQNEYKPSRKTPIGLAFLLACIGLFLINWAAHLLTVDKSDGFGWLLTVTGIGLVVWAVFLGRERN